MSIHDGPGIRTTLFTKGCNMRCRWCHNPETWRKPVQIEYSRSKCIGCMDCVNGCSLGAWSVSDRGVDIDRDLCNQCGVCSSNCFSGAIEMVGKSVSTEDLMQEIKQDIPFFNNSNGGVTVSGGEPTLQLDFTIELLEQCRQNGINTAIETNLLCRWESIERLLPLVDIWMCDLKCATPELHREWTGVDNATIIENLNSLSQVADSVIVRTPVVPGVNDNDIELRKIRAVVDNLSGEVEYTLLPFHSLGYPKYDCLGEVNRMPKDSCLEIDRDQFEQFQKLYSIEKNR